MATAATKYTPSKKRYDKRAVAENNTHKRYSRNGFSLIMAETCRLTMFERVKWIKTGQNPEYAFRLYFQWKHDFRYWITRARSEPKLVLPLPG